MQKIDVERHKLGGTKKHAVINHSADHARLYCQDWHRSLTSYKDVVMVKIMCYQNVPQTIIANRILSISNKKH